ncbi:MAG TPA: hydroxymethylbilane synthase [Bryobacteraceae bacterium]|nr:hydroxymethylbilane synthase [Bryobacteraceae bacterium]
MLVIGSRGSKLALWQAHHIQARLEELGQPSRIEVITTSGDRFQSGPLKEIGNKGLFTKEIEEALLDRRIDVAVHSLKDMPADLPNGLIIAATPVREDARDAMVGSRLADVPSGGKIGTGSLRRMAQIRAARPDITVEPVRGNVDTRLRKLDERQFDAIVLASAGLRRLGWEERIAEYLSPDIMCPAVGQGSLAIETRIADEAHDICAALNDPATRAAVTAERALLNVLGGSCQVPVGAHAVVESESLNLLAVVISPDGSTVVRREARGTVQSAAELGERMGLELLNAGAREILALVHGHAG